MGKYDPLSTRLAGHAGPDWRASFAEIEEVLGFPLPKSARAHRAWWGNEVSPHQPHKKAWLDHGWHAEDVDQAAELVTFRRKTGGAPSPVAETRAQLLALPGEPAILSRLEATPKLTFALVATGLTIAAGLSVFAIRGWMRRR
jgi:hypothetical protein